MKHVDGKKDIVSLSGGKPSGEYFPIGNQIEFTYKPIEGTEEKVTVNMDKVMDLNYNGVAFSKGLPELIEVAKKILIQDRYAIPSNFFDKYELAITSGSTDGMSKAVLLLTNPDEAVFCSEYTYTGIISATMPLERKLIGVTMDEDGMCPKSLAQQCEVMIGQGVKPKLVYLVPNGQNPTSITISSERRKKIYKVCELYDLVLLVDDPYCMMDFTDNAKSYQSFLEFDKSERVIRLDSFSKIIAPGFRIGTITAPKKYIDKVTQYTQVSSWGLGGINQKILLNLLKKMDFKEHINSLAKVYKRRRDLMVDCLNKISKDLISFEIPKHGVFVWVKVHKVTDSQNLVNELFKQKVSIIPGGIFSVSTSGKITNTFRIAFSYASDDEIKLGIEKLNIVLESLE